MGVVRHAAARADAASVRGPPAPGRVPGEADHQGGAAHRGLAGRDRERRRPVELHSRSSQGSAGLFRYAAIYPDGAPTGIPVHWPGGSADGDRRSGGLHRSSGQVSRPVPGELHLLVARGPDVGGPRGRVGPAERAADKSAERTAATRVRDRGAGDRQDGAGGNIPRGSRRNESAAHRLGTMRGAVRGGGSLSAGAGSAGTIGTSGGGRAADSDPQAACADLAGAAAGVVERPRCGGGAAPCPGGHARPDAARAGGGAGCPRFGRTARAAPGRPALERLGHHRPAAHAGTAAGTVALARPRHVPARRRGLRHRASIAVGQARATDARIL